MIDQWKQSFEGKYSREVWTHASGLYQVTDRSASFGRTVSRPFTIRSRERVENAFYWSRLFPGYYATADAAKKTVERHLKFVSGTTSAL